MAELHQQVLLVILGGGIKRGWPHWPRPLPDPIQSAKQLGADVSEKKKPSHQINIMFPTFDLFLLHFLIVP